MGGDQALWRQVEAAVHTLHIFGSAGIAAFGWALGRLQGWQTQRWLPLWFCAGLLVYNVDRLRPDPADEVNTPARVQSAQRLRLVSRSLVLLAGLVLLALPILSRDWLTLGAVVAGSLVCLHYSIPFRGKRWKDVALWKTFFAPGVVLLSLFGLPLLHEPDRYRPGYTPLVALWCAARLLANMILCDARDLAGDRAGGVVSLPEWLGPHRTERLLWMLLAGAAVSSAVLAAWGPPTMRAYWLALLPAGACYLAALIVAVRQTRSERFYERWVEGLLFLPAAVVLVVDLLGGAGLQ